MAPSSSSLLRSLFVLHHSAFNRRCLALSTIIYAVIFGSYVVFLAHLFLRSKSPLALINLAAQLPPPHSLPSSHSLLVAVPSSLTLPPPYSVIKEECKRCNEIEGPFPTCVEDLASISSTKYARGPAEVVSIVIDEIYNHTAAVLRPKLVEMLRNARENSKDHNFQQGVLEQCVEMSDKILNFMLTNEVVWDGGGTLSNFASYVSINRCTCLDDLAYEPDMLGKGNKPIQESVKSAWDLIDRLMDICSCIFRDKNAANMKLQELNPPPLMLFTSGGRTRRDVVIPVPPLQHRRQLVFNYLGWWLQWLSFLPS